MKTQYFDDKRDLDELRRLIEAFEDDHRRHSVWWKRESKWFLEYVKTHTETMTDRHRFKCMWCLGMLRDDPDDAEKSPMVLSFLRFCRKASKVEMKGMVVMANPRGRKLFVFRKNVKRYLRLGYTLPSGK